MTNEEETRKLLRETWHSMQREEGLVFQRSAQFMPWNLWRTIEPGPGPYDWSKLDEATQKIEQAEINKASDEGQRKMRKRCPRPGSTPGS